MKKKILILFSLSLSTLSMMAMRPRPFTKVEEQQIETIKKEFWIYCKNIEYKQLKYPYLKDQLDKEHK